VRPGRYFVSVGADAGVDAPRGRSPRRTCRLPRRGRGACRVPGHARLGAERERLRPGPREV